MHTRTEAAPLTRAGLSTSTGVKVDEDHPPRPEGGAPLAPILAQGMRLLRARSATARPGGWLPEGHARSTTEGPYRFYRGTVPRRQPAEASCAGLAPILGKVLRPPYRRATPRDTGVAPGPHPPG